MLKAAIPYNARDQKPDPYGSGLWRLEIWEELSLEGCSRQLAFEMLLPGSNDLLLLGEVLPHSPKGQEQIAKRTAGHLLVSQNIRRRKL